MISIEKKFWLMLMNNKDDDKCDYIEDDGHPIGLFPNHCCVNLARFG